MGREERFPVWEAALGAGVAAAFAAGLVGVYLSMPDSDYSFLKLPRNLEELQILTYVSRAPTHTLFISCCGRCPVSKKSIISIQGGPEPHPCSAPTATRSGAAAPDLPAPAASSPAGCGSELSSTRSLHSSH